jgi:O-acetylhomoserine (thiol)-lyase
MRKIMSEKTYHLETLALHAGHVPDPTTLARAVPVYRTTAYNFRDSQHGANLFALRELGNIYSRLMNPTNDVLEKRLAALEGGASALTLASGTAAVYFTITNILRQGDEFVAANNLYGGTFTQFDAILPQQGITVRWTPVNDFAAVEAAIHAKTRAIYIETVGNPGLDVADIAGYAALAKKYHLPLIVDATFTPPTLLRPIEHGADIVIHSLSKWIGGHGTAIGGVVIDAGKFEVGELIQVVFPAWEYEGCVYPEIIEYGFVDGFTIVNGYEVVPTLLKRKLDGTPSKQPLYCYGAKFVRIYENN